MEILIVLILIFSALLPLILAVLEFLLVGVWIVLLCIVGTVRNEIEDRRMRKEYERNRRQAERPR